MIFSAGRGDSKTAVRVTRVFLDTRGRRSFHDARICPRNAAVSCSQSAAIVPL